MKSRMKFLLLALALGFASCNSRSDPDKKYADNDSLYYKLKEKSEDRARLACEFPDTYEFRSFWAMHKLSNQVDTADIAIQASDSLVSSRDSLLFNSYFTTVDSLLKLGYKTIGYTCTVDYKAKNAFGVPGRHTTYTEFDTTLLAIQSY
jgi:hypothetical protein